MKKWMVFLDELFLRYFASAQNPITFVGVAVDGSQEDDASFISIDKTVYGAVWFTFAEHYGHYLIMMFYENLSNQD